MYYKCNTNYVLQCITMYYNVLQCITMYYKCNTNYVLQNKVKCITMYYNVLQM